LLDILNYLYRVAVIWMNSDFGVKSLVEVMRLGDRRCAPSAQGGGRAWRYQKGFGIMSPQLHHS
jgi:hypothetical protein